MNHIEPIEDANVFFLELIEDATVSRDILDDFDAVCLSGQEYMQPTARA